MAEVEIETTVNREQFVTALRRCADAIEGNRDLQLTLDGHTLNLRPQGKMEIKYEHEHGEHELEFEVKWREMG